MQLSQFEAPTARYDFDENPVQVPPLNPEGGIVFGTLAFDQNGLVRCTVIGDQSPESNHSSVDLRTGVTEAGCSELSGDGSEIKDDEGMIMASDQVCSVSESQTTSVSGEYSGEALASVLNLAEKKNDKEEFEFQESVPFDFSVSIVVDAPGTNGYSGKGARPNGESKDLNLSNNIWSNQVPLNYDPFGNHNDMTSGLSVRDMITSSDTLGLSALLNPSTGLSGANQFLHNIHLNNQMSHYAPPPMMTALSYGSSSSLNIVQEPLELVNSYNGLVQRHVAPDPYTHNIHLNGQVSPCTPAIGPMLADLSSGASSSLSNRLSVADGKRKASALRSTKMHKYMVELCMSRDGSQCLLDLIYNGNPTDIDTILEAVASDVFTVMAEEHGFTVLSNLLKFCDHSQKEFLLNQIVSDSVGVILRAQTIPGSNALIELVDHLIWSEQIHQVPSILATEIKPMLSNRFSSAVIQHCLEVLQPKQNERLIEAMIESACCLALDVHRCSFLYNLFDRLRGVHRTRLLNKLADNSVKLAFHGSGNYVVKRILDLQDTRITRKISYLLKGHYKSLSMDKYGSHVVETCLQSEGIHFVMEDFLKMAPKELEELACHQFANYVIKNALEATATRDLSYHRELVAALLPGLARIKESPHGKNVYRKLKDETHRRNGKCRHYYDAE